MELSRIWFSIICFGCVSFFAAYGQHRPEILVNLNENICFPSFKDSNLNRLAQPKLGWSLLAGMMQPLNSWLFCEVGLGVSNARVGLKSAPIVAEKLGYLVQEGSFSATGNDLSLVFGAGVHRFFLSKCHLRFFGGLYVGYLLNHDAVFTSRGYGRKDVGYALASFDDVLVAPNFKIAAGYQYHQRHTPEICLGYRLPVIPTFSIFSTDKLYLHLLTVGFTYRWRINKGT